MRHRIDDALETGLDTACSKLEDWATLEFEEQVRAEISGQLEDLQDKLGRTWEEDIREDVKDTIAKEVGEEVKEKMAGEVMRRVAKGVLGALGAYLRGDGDGCREKKGEGGAGAGGGAGNFLSHNLPPNEASLFAAVADVQKMFTAELTEEEMARVMDYLEENPLSAVKYNACGEAMRRYFVGRWKVDDTRGIGMGRGWRGGLR